MEIVRGFLTCKGAAGLSPTQSFRKQVTITFMRRLDPLFSARVAANDRRSCFDTIFLPVSVANLA